MEVDGSDRLEQLFKRLHIERVVFVDDKSLPEIDVGSVFSAVVTKPELAGTLADVFPGVDLSIDNNALTAQLGAVVDKMDSNALDALQRLMAPMSPDASELEDLLNLKGLMPASVQLSLMTPDEWVKSHADLVQQCTTDKRTLFLFDQDLNGDRARHGFTIGTDIIKSMSEADPEGFGTRWFCGLLSNTLEPGAEVASWRELANAHTINLKFFMPIAKGNLKDPPTFFGAVYRTVINTYCETMKSLAQHGFRAALETALERFNELDPIDFEHMVVGTSDKEGVSELDTLVRLYGIMHKDHVRENLLSEKTVVPFNNAAIAMKAVADLDRNLPAETHERMLQLRKSELYDTAALINGFHDPLRNGDLFQVESAEGGEAAQYVLMAQPCDLMVRGNGERGRERDFKIAFLAKITDITDQSPLRDEVHFELKYFSGDGGKTMKIEFPTATPANLFVLDLSVLQNDGSCILNPETILKTVQRFPTRSWDARVRTLVKHFKRTKIDVEAARKKHGDEAASCYATAIIPRVAQSSGLKKLGTYDEGAFAYTMKRTGRIRDPLATSALAAFGRYLVRDAYGHDFAKSLSA
jgi:hypothetical protein